MKILLLTEKPSQGMDFVRALPDRFQKKDGYCEGSKYIVTWAYGHLFEIDTEEIAGKKWRFDALPVFPKVFKYKVIRGVGKQFKVIKSLLRRKDVSKVYICGDPGREGELIARLILQQAGWKDWSRVYRFWTSEALTKDVILREIERVKPASQFDSLYYSALARQHADWLVGINGTRALTLKVNDRTVWSLGRVQTPLLYLIVQREKEIENFKPTPYGIVYAVFEKDGKKFKAYLQLKKEEIKRLKSESRVDDEDEEENKKDEGARLKVETAFKIAKELSREKFGYVIDIKKSKKSEKPPLLHSLTSLQREANRLYGYSAEKVLQVAQDLYEAKLISYPRTDARHLAESSKELVKKVLRKLGREDLIPAVDKVGKRVFDDRKLTDHFALIPMDKFEKKPSFKAEHEKVYGLIWRKFVGAFMPDYVYEVTEVILRLGNYRFLARGKREIQPGWMELYREQRRKESFLPKLAEKEKVKVNEVKAEKRKTSPPSRYTEGMLLKKMEKLGLGTPATRASIIETLKKRKYVISSKKSFKPTEKGRKLVEKCNGLPILNVEMTSEWEKALEKIYRENRGAAGYDAFIGRIKAFTKELVEEIKIGFNFR
ncbi:MAG: type IA DNA topoisomerase [Thermodesulfobacterium sp.]|nr:type IA DNA topoisomerase [Thermodesulfobacterium sp.]